MAITGIKVASLAAFILFGLAACAVQSGEDETSDQSAALGDGLCHDACCAKGGTWDSIHYLCCIPQPNGGKICTNRPEDVTLELVPTTPRRFPTVPTATATFAYP